MNEVNVLQAARLKGRISADGIAATVGGDPAWVASTIADLTASEMLTGDKTLRLSPAGRERLASLLAEERSGVDVATITTAYDGFRDVNADFKALVADWQLRDGQPNPHDDDTYDQAVLARLDGVHQRVRPILDAVAGQVPRLRSYSDKLDAALDKVNAGDTTWLTRPIMDSYHTVWFELHEELMGAAGLTRDEEAKAGHAQ